MEKINAKAEKITMRIPTDQEWDLLMDVTHEDDSLSHWNKMFSWVNDKENKYDLPASCRAVRGYSSARLWYNYFASNLYVGVGFRPAVDLEPGALSSDIRDGESVVIGTLYMDGKPVRVPQRPIWDGDITDYIPGAKLEMRPALDDPAYQVTAIMVDVGVAVADRNLLKCISYVDIEKALVLNSDIFPELRFYGVEDHEADLAFGECERELVYANEDAYHDNMGQFRIAFDLGGERYYCNVEAANMLEALGFFFREHPHITYDMVVFHEEA